MANEQAVSKAALITGCSTGIGRATAERLAGAGWMVYATARRIESIADLAEKGCRTMQLDVDNDESMQAAVQTVTEAEGAVGVLINNAGFSQSGAVETVAMDAVRKQFETNVFGPCRLQQLVLPKMREQGWGKIVNLSSMGGKLVFPGGGYYHATKYAIEAISDALRFEVRGFGIDVILFEPGLIKTDFASTVVRQMNGVPQDDGPYAKFNAAVRAATEGAYTTPPLSWMAGTAADVARTIEKAITASRPKARYKVAPSARMLMMQRKLSPDAVWDAFVGTQFPKPGKA